MKEQPVKKTDTTKTQIEPVRLEKSQVDKKKVNKIALFIALGITSLVFLVIILAVVFGTMLSPEARVKAALKKLEQVETVKLKSSGQTFGGANRTSNVEIKANFKRKITTIEADYSTSILAKKTKVKLQIEDDKVYAYGESLQDLFKNGAISANGISSRDARIFEKLDFNFKDKWIETSNTSSQKYKLDSFTKSLDDLHDNFLNISSKKDLKIEANKDDKDMYLVHNGDREFEIKINNGKVEFIRGKDNKNNNVEITDFDNTEVKPVSEKGVVDLKNVSTEISDKLSAAMADEYVKRGTIPESSRKDLENRLKPIFERSIKNNINLSL